jgi:gliding motility-associated-like protein
MKKVFSFLLTFFFLISLSASHMMGADMSYICLGNGKYKIIAKVYRDCRGISFNNPTTGATAAGCSSTSLAMTRTKIRDITPVCKSASAPCSPSNTTTGKEGVEEHTYEATIDLNQNPWANFKKNNCCQITFYIGQCCRNISITTGQSNQDFLTTCMLDICKIGNKCNSSPQLSNEPVAYLCCNQPFYFNNGAVDTADFDSLSYSLVNGMQSLSTSVSYGSGFSATIPMTPYCPVPGQKNCIPAPSAKPPRGFYLDKETGDIIFTPTDCSEVGVVVIQIDEFRRDSATKKWELIGRTRRDMQLIVTNCGPNNPPEIKGNNTYSVCEGDKICFKIDGTDKQFTPFQTKADTVQMKWNRGIPGATFTVTNPKDREKTAEFCWQTRVGQASDVFYTFTVTAADDNCPRPASSIRAFRVKVKKRAISSRTYTNLPCGRFSFLSTPEINFKGRPSYRWEIRDSTNTSLVFPVNSKQTDTVQFRKGGKYIITHLINNPEDCPTIYTDTVIIPPVFEADLSFGPDTFACSGTEITLSPRIVNGPSPYLYQWSTTGGLRKGDTLGFLVVKVTKDSTIFLSVKDKNGCLDEDTLKIYIKPLPIVDLGPDQRICTYEKTIFDANHKDTVKYMWSPTMDTTRTLLVHKNGKYKVRVTESKWKCYGEDSVFLFVNDTVVSSAGNDKNLCYKDTALIFGNGSPSSQTLNFSWRNISSNTPMGNLNSIRVYPSTDQCYELYLRVTQGGHSCEDKDTVCVKIISLPDLKSSVPSRCYDYGDRNLGVESGLGVKFGKGVKFWYPRDTSMIDFLGTSYIYKTTKIKNSDLQGGNSRSDVIWVSYMDPSTGCFNKDSFAVTTNGNPIVKLRDRIYCQDKGCALLDSSIIIPKIKTGALYSWTISGSPSGVPVPSLIKDKNQGTGLPPIYEFCFGESYEDFYGGTYNLEFFIQDPITGCFTRESSNIQIIGEPKVKVLTLPQVCLDEDTIDLNQYVTLNGITDPMDGRWISISKDMDRSDPSIKTCIIGGRYFIPSSGDGDWELKFIHEATGCYSSDSGILTVKSLPKVILPLDLRVCSTDPPVILNPSFVSPPGGYGSWNGKRLSGSGNNIFTPGSEGKSIIEGPYSLVYTYTDPFGCKTKDSLRILVQSFPYLKILNPSPQRICEGQTLDLRGRFLWSNGVLWSSSGDGSFSSQDTFSVYTPGSSDTGKGFFLLRIKNIPPSQNVCPNVEDSLMVQIHKYPEVEFVGTPIEGCEPLTSSFSSKISNIPPLSVIYKWDFGNGDTSSSPNPSGIIYSKWGKYKVEITAINPSGPCSTTLSKPSYVDVWPVPFSNFVTDPISYTTIALPKFFFFNLSQIEDKSPLEYRWNFGTKSSADTSREKDPIFSYGKDTSSYIVSLITISDKGCRDTSYRFLRIGPDIIVFIPNSFTPDGSGSWENNTFRVSAYNYSSFNIKIFNRWGEKLYESPDINKGWDGTANGSQCQQGVYAYLVEISTAEGKIYKFTGTVTLLR